MQTFEDEPDGKEIVCQYGRGELSPKRFLWEDLQQPEVECSETEYSEACK